MSATSDASVLAKSRLFQGLEPAELEALAAAARGRSCPKGHTLLTTGHPNRSLFVIKSGRVQVVRIGIEKELDLTTLGPGQVLGELSFLDQSQATATVRTLEDCELPELTRTAVDELMGKLPGLGARLWRSLALLLKERLLAANRAVDHYADMEQLLRDRPELRDVYGGV